MAAHFVHKPLLAFPNGCAIYRGSRLSGWPNHMNLAMNTSDAVAALLRIAMDSVPPNQPQSRLSGMRNGRRLARIIALCFCVLTFAQLASTLPAITASSFPQIAPYRFSHFPCEEVGGNGAGASTPTVLQFGKVGVTSSPRPRLRTRAESAVFMRLQPLTLVHRRILPPSSDDDH